MMVKDKHRSAFVQPAKKATSLDYRKSPYCSRQDVTRENTKLVDFSFVQSLGICRELTNDKNKAVINFKKIKNCKLKQCNYIYIRELRCG